MTDSHVQFSFWFIHTIFLLDFLIPSFPPSFLPSYFKDSQICTRIICILVNVDMTPDLTLSAFMAQKSIVHMEC